MNAGGRLLPEPVFLLSPPRSGSTLLRSILDTHSQIRSPQELHLKYLQVRLESDHCRMSLQHLGYPEAELRYLLWDRLLHEELRSRGKQVLVEKSPCNIDILDELRYCWPGARFVVLLRHPRRVARSMLGSFPDYDLGAAISRLTRVDEARQRLMSWSSDVLTVNYENLVAYPAPTSQRLCEYLGVAYEPEMISYGRRDHGPYLYGLGDWGDRISSGIVLPEPPAGPVPDAPALAAICQRWGYEYDRSFPPGW